jgi:xanthine dehydrogenase/oxidase
MNMHSLMEANDGKVTMKEIENSFGGNTCRCTGYRPILDAFKSLAVDADENLVQACKDIEDLNDIKLCNKTGLACSGNCSEQKESLHFRFSDEREWHKVIIEKEIFEIFEKIGNKRYMLVAGNTGHGVFRRPRDIQVFIDINSVNILKDHNLDSNLEIGGGVNLTEMMEIFKKAADVNPNFSYLLQLVKHIDLVAHVPVRNSGTIAGNLMIKNEHREFPSDIFLMSEGVGAILTIAESESSTFQKTPQEFLELDMNKKLLLKITYPQLDPSKYICKSYKILPRAQNAHAIVNATFLVQFNETGQVVSARICFGGINPHFVHALKTEQFLVGKDLYSNGTLTGALNVLHTEVNPDWILPDLSPDYRKNLAMALFYKFILSTAPAAKANSRFKSGGEILARELSSGRQTFDTIKKNWPLTKNIPKIEAEVQCTGEAKYVNDLPALPDELYCAFTLARLVHRRIKGFDASMALVFSNV